MEERYSCHFPGCRKGAHCNCDICLDNINANLDCHSTFKSPLSLSFLLNAPMLNALRFLSILELSLHRDHVIVLNGVSEVLVRDLGPNRRVSFLQSELKDLLPIGRFQIAAYEFNMGNQQGWAALEFTVRLVQVSNGRGEHMGLAFANRRGLLKTEFSSRSFTVLSGRVTEWSDRKIGYFIRKASTSRVHSNWAASAVQLDPNTWILEYESSLTLDNSMLFSAVAGVFKYRMSRALKSMNPGFWLFSDFECQYSEIIPT